MTKAMEELGQRIAAARIHQGYYVNGAAEAAGISRETWAKIEAGESVQDVKRAAALQLLGLDDYGNPADVGAATEDPGYVGAQQGDLVEQNVEGNVVLAEVRAMRGDLDALERRLDRRLDSLSERVARVESRPEPLGGPDGQT